MNVLVVIGLIALFYFIVYGIFRLLSSILVAIKLPWAAVIVGCIAIIIKFHQYSFLNYIVVSIALILLGRLLITQILNIAGRTVSDREEYHETLGESYACLFSFLSFGTLYANMNYILSVQIAELSFEEYKEAGPFAGKALSAIGFGPIKWLVLGLAAVAFFQVSEKTTELGMINTKTKGDNSSIKSYYSSVLGIPISLSKNTVEANRIALKKYFLPLLQNQDERAEKLAEVTLNIAAIELSEPNEILEALIEDSGLSKEEVLKCFPKLKSRSN